MSKNVTLRNGGLFCGNCGGTYVLVYPLSIGDMTKKMDAFDALHEDCKKTWKEPMYNPALSVEERAKWWKQAGERGLSSESLWDRMMGLASKGVAPADADDFKRCRNLIMCIPEWRGELHKMKELSTAWSNLVDNWDKLDQMYDRIEEKGVGREMNELIRTLTQ